MWIVENQLFLKIDMNLDKIKNIIKRFRPPAKGNSLNTLLIIGLSTSLFLLYGKNELFTQFKRNSNNLETKISSLGSTFSILENQIEELEPNIEDYENEKSNIEDELDKCKEDLNNLYYL